MVPDKPNDVVNIALRSQDIQTGLQEYKIDEFEVLLKVGMAARLAIHLRGGDVADYNRLKEVSVVLFGIEKLAFPSVITLLEEVGFITVARTGSNRKIIPKVPYFDDLYQTLGEKARLDGLNDLEQSSIEMLHKLSGSPLRKDVVQKALNVDFKTLEDALRIGKAGSYLNEVERRDGSLLVSPMYFAENGLAFANVVAKYGDPAFRHVFNLLRANPGWPLSLALGRQSIGSTQLSTDEMEILSALVNGHLLQPPAISTTKSGTNHFLFTPPIGTSKIPVTEKEIYEKAMAVISCVRQGEHFATWTIRDPRLVINALLREGALSRAISEAKEQYRALVIKKIAKLEPPGAAWQRVVLINTIENRRALRLAVELMSNLELIVDRGVTQENKEIIFGDKDYAEYIRGYGLVRQSKIIPRTSAEKQAATEKLLEAIQKGG